MKYLAVVTVISLLGACRTVPNDQGQKPYAVFYGETRKAPISPIEHEGVDNSAPLPGAPIHIQSSALDTIVTTDLSAHFSLTVPAEAYTITPMELPDKWPSPPAASQVTVSGPHDTLHWTFVYETHIR